MQQFTVPQFIDVEDRIIGPISVRQFVILLIASFFVFLAYRLLRFDYFLVSAILLFFGAGVLAFFKVNGQPFHYFVLNLVQTKARPGIRIWLKAFTNAELKLLVLKKPEARVPAEYTLKNSLEGSGLSELSLIVDTGGAYKGEEDI
ncbi:PrgI family protein [Candidatus Uhrbacteria bacterium]|nr:PrgI family protein [Candidatus Uhrbacteria bacterium]